MIRAPLWRSFHFVIREIYLPLIRTSTNVLKKGITMSNTATKEKSTKHKSTVQDSVLPPDLIESLGALPAMVNKLEKEISGISQEMTDIRDIQENIDRKTVPSQIKSAVKEAASELAEDGELEREIEKEEADLVEGGPIRRSARWTVNLLPQGRRERGQFMAGFVLGSATSGVVAPIGIIAASIARGRVILSN